MITINKTDYSKVGLYKHNIIAYEKIKQAEKSGQKIVGIVHATGTGKTYISLQLIYDNKNKKTLYVVPSNAIKEHIIKTIKDNPNLDFKTDFKNLEFITFQSISQMSEEELKHLDYDYLVIDEFHHIGAPIWGKKIKQLMKLNPNKFTLGMTAYTTIYRGTSYERDVANPETEEIFSNKIVSRYDLVDALIDGILPKPIYRSAYLNLTGFIQDIEERLEKVKISKKTYKDFKKILDEIKSRIHNTPSLEKIYKQNLKPDGKYIYFCPIGGTEGINDVDTIMKETREQLEKNFPQTEIVFYKTTSKDKELGKLNRDAFYDDYDLNGTSTKGKLRIMFAINQYNEGVHAPNIDGVIMGRGTKSDIVFFEQLGRALSVREDTKKLRKELNEKSIEELITLSVIKKIDINIEMTKEEIIERLLSPIVIDLSNNYEYIEELQNNLKDRVKQVQENYGGTKEKRTIKINSTDFDIDIIDKDLFEMLKKLRNKLSPMTWDAWYDLAKKYYEFHGNLKMKEWFKTFNGVDYDPNGLRLYQWIIGQKVAYKNGKLTKERMEKLDAIGATPKRNLKKLTWDEWYQMAKNYFNYYGNLEVPRDFKTWDGINYDETGRFLYNWLENQNRLDTKLRFEIYYLKLEEKEMNDKEKSNSMKRILEERQKVQKLEEISFYSNFQEYSRTDKRKYYKNKKKLT